MLDLEHLDALDDDAPPEPDLGQARQRAGRMRVRRRVTAIAVGVALLAGAVAVGAVVRDDDDAVRVAGPSGPTGVVPEDHPRVTGTLPNGLEVEMTLDTPTVVLGSDITATVVVHNPTSEEQDLGVGKIQSAIDLAPFLRDPSGHEVANGADQACYLPARVLRPGASRTLAVTLSTRLVERAGQYELTLEKTSGEQPPWTLGPVSVRITAPEGLSARLELPKSTYPSGYSLEGTIIFVNGTGAPVDYEIDCTKKEPWDVLLSKDGVLFYVVHTGPYCGRGTIEHLAPGTTRIPFYLSLAYPACGNAGEPTLASPRCVGDPPGTPDLPPGRYQLVFRGTGAPFESLDVAPLDVDVVRRPQVTDGLPRITSATVKGAQLEFQRLYLASDAPYRAALIGRHITPLLTATMGDRLLVTIATSPNAHQAEVILLSLFDHPELVTVESADPNEVGRQ